MSKLALVLFILSLVNVGIALFFNHLADKVQKENEEAVRKWRSSNTSLPKEGEK